MTRRGAASVVANPVLVGAVTLLVVIVAVWLAYNANQGLPFVPTYNVSAELPGGANLVAANEVRVGGFRVGIVDRIRSKVDPQTNRAIAVIDMKLDQKIAPLPEDTHILVRPRSALGLKYVELTLGRSPRGYKAGDTIPLRNATQPIEIDEFFSTYNDETRSNQRRVLFGYGTALAGRGTSINLSIQALVPFLTHLEPVFRNLSDPRTRLNQFFRQAGRVSAQIAPVAPTYARLFGNMATTFEALGRSPESLQQTIERSPPTLEAGIRSLPVQRPFLEDSRRLFIELEPAAAEFERSLPAVSRALEVGAPVQLRVPALYRRTEGVFRALVDLAENPNTLLGLRDLRTTLRVAAPLVTFVAPYQTVCNFWNYYWTPLGEHISEPIRGGTIQRVHLKTDSRNQDNRVGDTTADRPVDLPMSADPQETRDQTGAFLQALHSQSYSPAIDAQGNADCQVGQYGYLNRLITGGRYPPSDNPAELGGSHVVRDSDTPGLAGPTYRSRELGIRNLRNVP